MLSILIPIYNTDCRALVKALSDEMSAKNMNGEILCYDDHSEARFHEMNQALKSIKHCTYFELPQNIGRSRIRNKMAKEAKHPFLLFLDGDSIIVTPHFLENYLREATVNTVVVGGRIYQKEVPANVRLHLHWRYGTRVESMDAAKRKLNPHSSFMSNNFLMAKSDFETILFDENIEGYGHEDTLFGVMLRKRELKVVHISNPLQHEGLEDAAVFLSKTKEGIRNLNLLFNKIMLGEEDVKLLRIYTQVRRFMLIGLIAFLYSVLRTSIEKSFMRSSPSLHLFNFYKLGYLIQLRST